MDFEQGFFSQEAGCTLVIQDNGRVGYAYLLDANSKIVADVWLYNRASTPVVPEWHMRENAPFLNPVGFAGEASCFPLPRAATDVAVEWDQASRAKILIQGHVAGILSRGAKPGWAANALKDGPLAKVLV